MFARFAVLYYLCITTKSEHQTFHKYENNFIMRRILIFAVLVSMSLSAFAQLDFGVKGGLNVSHMALSSSVVSSNNRTGFYIGPTMKFIVPIVHIGFDLSLLYDQRQGGVFVGIGDEPLDIENGKLNREEQIVHQRQIVVPLNLRYQLGLGDTASLLFFAGPQLGLNVGSKVRELDWRWRSANLSINAGLGVMLLNHVQVNANYNIACGRVGNFNKPQTHEDDKGKLSAWQVGLAYYF